MNEIRCSSGNEKRQRWCSKMQVWVLLETTIRDEKKSCIMITLERFAHELIIFMRLKTSLVGNLHTTYFLFILACFCIQKSWTFWGNSLLWKRTLQCGNKRTLQCGNKHIFVWKMDFWVLAPWASWKCQVFSMLNFSFEANNSTFSVNFEACSYDE